MKIEEKIVNLTERNSFLDKSDIFSKSRTFTNGCFDILHFGHVKYLEAASHFSELLVIGLNTDDSIRRIKGPSRPINSEYERAYVLAALQFVDYVFLFNEDTPLELIKLIKPDVLVKGSDYKPEEIVGSDFVKKNGGKVLTIPLTHGFSTTNIINKINSSW